MYYTIVSFLLIFPLCVSAQADATSTYVKATVLSVQDISQEHDSGTPRSSQHVTVLLLNGPHEGAVISLEHDILYNRSDMRIEKGETVILQGITKINGESEYLFREKYRLPSLLLLTLLFFGLGILLGGIVGVTSLIGLSASIGILLTFVIPSILAGYNPLLISIFGSIAIAITSLYLAHGINRRTTIALISTICTLLLSTGLALLFVHLGKLFGMGSEESLFLQGGMINHINLQGLLLGGMIIGALGVLDDITTAQTAAIDELSKANTSFSFSDLYRAGTSIGREHIASLINTLALAYVGASLPMLLLFFLNEETPWWVIINSEFVAEEIVRTLVGSSALLLAVPISTWMASRSFQYGNHTNSTGHCHVHEHVSR